MPKLRLLALGTLLAAACAARSATPAAHPATQPTARNQKTIELEPVRIDVLRTGEGTESRAYDARSLLDDGNDALMQRRYDEAIAAYEHLLSDFPDSRLVLAALYNEGLALEGKADWTGAADRYRKLVAAAPAGDADAKNAQYRLGAVLAETNQFGESARVFEKVLERDDLSPGERIEGLARLGYALVETEDYAGAEEILRSALGYHRQIQGTTHLETGYYVAMCQYYLAEIPHRQFLSVPLRYPEQQMTRDLEQKSTLFLLARDRYVQTVELKDPYWATAAVFQVGLMYKQFWDGWMAVPVPAEFNAEEVKAYVKEVNHQPQLRKLLEKSLLFHERNLSMARGANVDTVWSQASETEASAVKDLIARQERGELIVPGQAPAMSQPRDIGPPTPAAAGGASTPADYLPGRVEL